MFLSYIFNQQSKGKAVLLWAWSGPEDSRKLRYRQSSPVTGLEWPRGFQEVKVKVKQSRYRPGVAQRIPGS